MLKSTLSKSKTWFNVTQWKDATVADKILHIMLWISMFVLWTSLITKSLQQDINLDSIARICETLSISFGGLINWYRVFDHGRQRQLMTKVVATINEKVLSAKRSLDQEEIRNWNLQYVLLFWSIGLFYISLSGYFLSLIFWSFYHGEHYYKMALPFERPSYGLLWTLELIVQETVLVFAVCSYTFCEGIVVDCILQLTFLYNIECQKLRNVQANDPQCEKSIVAVFKELLELKG